MVSTAILVSRVKPLEAAVMACASFVALTSAAEAATGRGPIVMVPHRAVYDMHLAEARSGSSVTDVEGRMVFEITGSACEGYTQTMRFVTKMGNAEGQPTITDLRSSTFEDGAATQFRFTSVQLRNEKPEEAVSGEAVRPDRTADLALRLSQPEKKAVGLGRNIYLPVQHSIALVEAGRSGQVRFKADYYDGSEQGDKVYETSSTIGREIPPGGNRKLPLVANAAPLDALSAWPITVSYYEKGKDREDAAPVYELGYLFYENGVSRNLVIDYGEFSIKGDLKEITFLDPSPRAETCALKR